MPLEPDFVVTSREGGGYSVVVEVKGRYSATHDRARAQLKQYMMAMRCPVAVLITPDAIEILRETYADFSPGSIESVGSFEAPGEFARVDLTDAFALEKAAQDWLEGLRVRERRAQLRPALRTAVEEYLLPALTEGAVVAARPRRGRASTG